MIRIEIDDAPVLGALNRLLAAGQDMRAPMRAISEALVSQTHANFSAQSGPLGRWPKLKDKKRAGGKILQDKGHLASSISEGASYGKDFAFVGSDRPYAAIHQLGGDIHKAAQSRPVRHRTDAQGNLLRTALFGGNGLIFAKGSHKRAAVRWFEHGEHTVHIPARPYLPVFADGRLQPQVEASIIDIVNASLAAALAGS